MHYNESLYYESCTKRRPGSVATSLTFPGHQIGRTDGPDRVSPGLFAKKPQTLVESTLSPGLLSVFFSKKPSNFTEINPQSRPFKWAGLPPARACISLDLGFTGPNSARRCFSIFLRIYYLSKPVEIL